MKRLQTFGVEALGTKRWKSALADACGISERVIHYWLSGHCPEDLDEKLLAAANTLISEHHRRASVIRAFREQLEQGAE